MNLIYYRGLNCHLASIVNIADLLGVNYTDAFDGLWSEIDFTDEVKYNIYTSKRVFKNLEKIGVIIKMLDCDKTEEGIAEISDGELFLVGMDTFYIPWHPIFNNFHDFHYFFAQKKRVDSFLGFDPVYNKKNQEIKSRDIILAAFELGRINKIDVVYQKYGALQEARAVLHYHPDTEEKLLIEILKCREKKNIGVLIKQISAMINNRYLFKHFLQSSTSENHEQLFDKDYFLKWEAVRNGLYKASVVKENKAVIDEVCSLFSSLMNQEIAMAKEIVSKG